MNKLFCNKCGECCKNIVIDFEKKILYRDGIEPLTQEFEKMLIPFDKKDNVTLCKCKFLENNLCTNSAKPTQCIIFPSSPFAFLPENCGYYGEIFLKNEKIKQKIRKIKEEILLYEIQAASNPSAKKELQRIIYRHQSFLNKYNVYGAADW